MIEGSFTRHPQLQSGEPRRPRIHGNTRNLPKKIVWRQTPKTRRSKRQWKSQNSRKRQKRSGCLATLLAFYRVKRGLYLENSEKAKKKKKKHSEKGSRCLLAPGSKISNSSQLVDFERRENGTTCLLEQPLSPLFTNISAQENQFWSCWVFPCWAGFSIVLVDPNMALATPLKHYLLDGAHPISMQKVPKQLWIWGSTRGPTVPL